MSKQPEMSQTQLESTASSLARSLQRNEYELGRVLLQLATLAPVKGYCGGKYPRFQDFCRGELGFSTAKAHKLMRVAQAFSPEEIAKHGAGMCDVIVGVTKTKADRERAKALANEGATKADILRVFLPAARRNTMRDATRYVKYQNLTYEQIESAAFSLPRDLRMKLASNLFDSLKRFA